VRSQAEWRQHVQSLIRLVEMCRRSARSELLSRLIPLKQQREVGHF
jgi:hypothetical protein